MKIKMQEDQTPDFILRELPEVPPIKCWACGKAIYGKYIVLDGGIDQGGYHDISIYCNRCKLTLNYMEEDYTVKEVEPRNITENKAELADVTSLFLKFRQLNYDQKNEFVYMINDPKSFMEYDISSNMNNKDINYINF